jgi:hypothetical protein
VGDRIGVRGMRKAASLAQKFLLVLAVFAVWAASIGTGGALALLLASDSPPSRSRRGGCRRGPQSTRHWLPLARGCLERAVFARSRLRGSV